MKRLALLPLLAVLGCEGIGASYNAMQPALKAAVMALVALAFAATARYVIPQRVYFSETE